ncbi:MAG: YdeI/OmpD-associated family protein, partial [Acidimicrobiales bacterium]
MRELAPIRLSFGRTRRTGTALRPRASRAFARLDKANRYSVLYRVTTARRPDTRARRIERLGQPIP